VTASRTEIVPSDTPSNGLSTVLATVPAGACDCHVHVMGLPIDYPMVAARHYTPGPASPGDLQRHLDALRFQRTVIIQSSIYGTDNRCTLDALQALNAQHPNSARAVLVLPPAVTPTTLTGLHEMGVRGIRLNIESSSGRDGHALHDQLQHWAPLLASLGWHCQVFAAADLIAAAARTIRELTVPVVLDHFAMIDPGAASTEAAAEVILDVLRDGHVYIKLSAPYRIGRLAPGFQTPARHQADQTRATALAKTLLATRPDRLLWASDWPHTQRESGLTAHDISRYRDITPTNLLHGIASWLDTPEARQQVLVDNPARLYGFG
jgi:predicted TIM-barrel fold metal-dependent hydrolase